MSKNVNNNSQSTHKNQAKATKEVSPIVSVVTNEIYPYASVGEGLAPSALRKSKKAEKGLASPTSSKPDSIITDPNGSYTGTPIDPTEVPVQDVDDL